MKYILFDSNELSDASVLRVTNVIFCIWFKFVRRARVTCGTSVAKKLKGIVFQARAYGESINQRCSKTGEISAHVCFY
ncbi:MAG: hypothetical protein QS748_01665 [Candidatus Endonucleobacter bathymodioli]|uniref:Uncharacterized protein n=1 Tax=Candidatus Endonucleibacter bathymodioli TaxID=539814 RepID=A0AA90SWS3_9GAMM|nr:hypothetical protein [Candidatus Endonucleobacter bathymodioli]